MNEPALRILFTRLLVLLLVLLVLPVFAEPISVEVFVNESKSLSLPEQFSEYALGNDDVAGIVVRKNEGGVAEVVINGVAEGTTNLIFWGLNGQMIANFDIVVKARDLGQLLADVRKQIASIPGITAEVSGEKVILKGEALTPQDMKTLTKLFEGNKEVLNTVTLSATALKVITDIINDFVGGEGQITIKPIGQSLVLSGISYGKGSAKRVEEFAKIFHHSVVNLIKERDVGLEPGKDKMIQVHAHFMEVNKKVIQGQGGGWMPFGNASASGAKTGNKTSGAGGMSSKNTSWTINGFLGNLLPQFYNDKERSFGRQLQSSSISVRSGEKGNFQSGGEIGYPVTSSLGQTTIVFKKYGVHIEVLPIAQGKNITLKIKVKVNIPVSLTAGGYLAFTNSEVETVQYCRAGESVALSGLVGHRDRKIFDATPGGSGALFELYSSEDFQKDKSELIIFITPEIIAKAGDALMETRQKVMDDFESYDPVSR